MITNMTIRKIEKLCDKLEAMQQLKDLQEEDAIPLLDQLARAKRSLLYALTLIKHQK